MTYSMYLPEQQWNQRNDERSPERNLRIVERSYFPKSILGPLTHIRKCTDSSSLPDLRIDLLSRR